MLSYAFCRDSGTIAKAYSPHSIMSKPFPRTLLICLIALGLAACAGRNPGPISGGAQAPSAQSAEAARASGRYEEAANQFLALGRQSLGAQRTRFLLEAGDAALAAQRIDLAEQALAVLRQGRVEASQTIRVNLLEARLDLAQGQARQALRLAPVPAPDTPAALAADILLTRAKAFFKLGETIDGVSTMVDRNHALKTAAAIAQNRETLWQLLQQAPLSGTALQNLQQADTITRGWIGLAQIDRSIGLDTTALNQRLADWQKQYPNHPASERVVPEMRRRHQALGQYSGRIALILPLQGRYEVPASAIREGFLYAYYQRPPPRPPIHIYLSNGDGSDVVSLYRQALADGARAIVGPLSKPAVTALARSANGNVPILALNYLDNTEKAPPDFFEFGLSPADEAAQVARRAAGQGMKRALALVPQGNRGQRILQAFRDELRAQGGSLVDYAVYDPHLDDYSQVITYLLQTGGNRPQTRPANLPVSAVPYDPHRRNDMDFIFLAAQPQQARLIRPQLRFYHASHVPVYSTSAVYTGHPDPQHDRDMDGIRFCDMPWTLSSSPDVAELRLQANKLWPELMQAQPRLFALGYDAYRLIPLIAANALSQDRVFPAVTGALYLAKDGHRVQRRLACAEFHSGKPQVLDGVIQDTTAAAKQ